MALLDDVKKRMMAAMKAGDTVQKEVLRVIVGEITMGQARGVVNNEEDSLGVVRKLLKSNEETLGLATDATQRETLTREIAILREFLPQTLGVDAIVDALAGVSDAVRAAGNDGQATGIAMKTLKAAGALVEGKDVTAAVKRIRGTA